MLVSLEMRWFVAGQLPAAIEGWLDDPYFSSCGEAAWREATNRPRNDHYLVLPHADWISVKLRTGKAVEIKRRVADYGVHQVGEHLIGRMTQWEKWSFDLADGVRFVEHAPDMCWLTLEKQRRQRKYEVSPQRTVLSVDPARKDITRGCGIEVTALKLNDAAWWTLAFEAFGAPPYDSRVALRETLERTLSFACRVAIPTHLSENAASDYPAWLRQQALGGRA